MLQLTSCTRNRLMVLWLRQMTVQIWDVALAMYRKDSESEIYIEGICEVVHFEPEILND
jgi:hypothetical protein